MTEEQQKEQFSIAYVRAVAAAARVVTCQRDVDADSIDIGFAVKSVAGCHTPPRLEAQIKCTTHLGGSESVWRYRLKVKNYNELLGTHYIPRILIVVSIPPSVSDWINQTEECLSLYKCGYWVSLRGLDRSKSTSKVTISIPKDQVFSPDAFRQLLTGDRL